MPKADAGTAPLQKGAGDRFNNKINPLVVAGAIQREEEIRKRFVTKWGEILINGAGGGAPPTTLQGLLDMKKTMLSQLRSSMDGRPAADIPMLSTYAQLERTATLNARGQGPEGVFGKKYKVAKAGV